jgi:glycosyltransferase involved in cell wall biosynthesis
VLNSPYLAKSIQPSKPAIFLLGSQMAEDGIQPALIHQARWFYGRGYRVVAAFLGDPEGLQRRWQARLPVPLVNLQAIRPGASLVSTIFHTAEALLRASRLFAVGEFNIIETFGAAANLFGLPLARLASVPVRVANYSCQPVPPRLVKMHARTVNRYATQIVAVTAYAKQLGVSDGIPPEKMNLVRRGVQMAEEIDWQLRRRLRNELEVPDDGCLIASAGGMQSAQAYHDLLQAVPCVLEQFPLSCFALIGEGPARAQLIQMARQLGIAAHMRFPSRRSDVLRLIAAADIYFAPAAFEGLPPYLLEAMAAQRPIVATNSEQIKEFLRPGQSALLVEPGDLVSLSNNLIDLISSAETRLQMGSRAHECMQQDYGLERMCAEYAVLLDPSYHVEIS